MSPPAAIGDFSRATHLNIKTRHYDRIELLVAADGDPGSGHCSYRTDQIRTAQVIRRFRTLDMPLEEIDAHERRPLRPQSDNAEADETVGVSVRARLDRRDQARRPRPIRVQHVGRVVRAMEQ
jgi:DNA-binding transcriptional MerR regulator